MRPASQSFFKLLTSLPAVYFLLIRWRDKIRKSVVEGKIPSYALESKLGDCRRAAAIRRATSRFRWASQGRCCSTGDAKNPLVVVDYVEDLYVSYKKMESSRADYMAQQFDINEKMRAILIDGLIEGPFKWLFRAKPKPRGLLYWIHAVS